MTLIPRLAIWAQRRRQEGRETTRRARRAGRGGSSVASFGIWQAPSANRCGLGGTSTRHTSNHKQTGIKCLRRPMYPMHRMISTPHKALPSLVCAPCRVRLSSAGSTRQTTTGLSPCMILPSRTPPSRHLSLPSSPRLTLDLDRTRTNLLRTRPGTALLQCTTRYGRRHLRSPCTRIRCSRSRNLSPIAQPCRLAGDYQRASVPSSRS